MTEHFCIDNTWKPGASFACDLHAKNRNVTNVILGRKARAKLDKEAGTVGTHRGDFISGTDSGR